MNDGVYEEKYEEDYEPYETEDKKFRKNNDTQKS